MENLTRMELEQRLSMPGLEFSEEGHVYTLDGEVLPSVTQVMEPLSRHEYARVDAWTLDRAASRGTAVHGAIETYIKYGIYDVDPDHRGYMDGFIGWWHTQCPEPVGSEVRVYHELYRYAGTVDLLCMLDGKLMMVDFKTTSKLSEKNVRVQLEAYAQALRSHGVSIERKAALHLMKDGKWKLVEFEAMDAHALRVFTSLKCIHDYIQE